MYKDRDRHLEACVSNGDNDRDRQVDACVIVMAAMTKSQTAYKDRDRSYIIRSVGNWDVVSKRRTVVRTFEIYRASYVIKY